MSKEQIYDDQIAPLVEQIIQISKEHKINSHLSFFLDDDLVCTTHLPVDEENVPLTFELLRLSAYCCDNLDLLFTRLLKYMKSKNINYSSSLFFRNY